MNESLFVCMCVDDMGPLKLPYKYRDRKGREAFEYI